MTVHIRETLLAGYKNAKIFYEGVFNINKLALNTTVVPYWVDEDCFWFRRKTWQGSEFRLVNAKDGSNQAVFDHQSLASALTGLVNKPVEANNLPITKVVISSRPLVVRFESFGQQVIYNAKTKRCTFVDPAIVLEEQASSVTFNTEMLKAPNKSMSGEKFISPDGIKSAFVRDFNLWVEELETGEQYALTHDGKKLYAYAMTPISMGAAANVEIQALWSPDSKRIYTVQTDNRQVNKIPVVHYVPEDGGIRPEVTSYAQARPGDNHVEEMRLVSIDVNSRKIQAANYRRIPILSNATHGLFVNRQAWWATDSRLAYFVDMEYGAQTVRVVEFDTYTGYTRCLFEEASDTYIKVGCYGIGTTIQPLPDSNELIWYSERSGWAHLYLYDMNTGALKRPVTQGEWLVRNILHVDAKRRELWIQTAGRVEGRDPYYQDICRVNIDTGELTPVVSGSEEYTVLCPGTMAHYMNRYYDPDRFINADAISPSSQYVITTRSRVDQAPVSLLLNRNGDTLLEIEAANISALPSDWKWPESVKTQAVDGKSMIDGAIFRPSSFSPDKCYPIIDLGSNAPDVNCVPKGGFLNNVYGSYFYLHAAALAELGFIVVIIEGRGLPGREKDFSHANYRSLTSSNYIEDRIAGIQQLAKQYPYMDLNRVGILGLCSSGSELLLYPDFYKVGVYQGILDSRFLPTFYSSCYGDKGDGQPVETLAKHLQGKLLLIDDLLGNKGAATLRLVNALQQANKDFDLLLFPNTKPERYAFRRAVDYFVTHLQGLEPPKEFSFDSDE